VPEATDAIISIHPDYADAILAGTKTVELRRRAPDLPIGSRLWIYATQPIGAVTGFVTIGQLTRGDPVALWKEHGDGTGIDNAAFKAYFNGSQFGVAIGLSAARRVERPVTITQLRHIRDNFRPPRVLTRLTSEEARALRKLAEQ
jgi:predicted transcriptional regulator